MNVREDSAYMEWWQTYGEMAEPEIEYPAWKAGRAYQHRFEKEQAAQQKSDKVPSWLCVCGRTYNNVTVGFSCPCGAVR